MRFAEYPLYLSLSLSAILSNNALTCASQDLRWPYNLPSHVKYYPEDEALVKKNNDILQRLKNERPQVVKKMSPHPEEMFFLDYWFHDEEYKMETVDNTSSVSKFDAPMPLHATSISLTPRLWERHLRLPIPAASLFAKRDFVCPSGTNACTSIGRPNVCCPTTSTCQIVQDTGLGDVGCCDAAQTCAGSLSQCPSGYTGCPNNGGGCCLPGYACFQQGCVQTSTTIVVITPSSTTTSSTLPPPSPSTIIDTTTVIVTSSVSVTSTVSSPTLASTTQATTSTSVSTLAPSQPNSLVCSSGFRSCPATLGGGCCPTDRACARDACPALTSTASLVPPVRGTSSTLATTSSFSGCPTGFYACSAYNPGGCCQVDRDCRSTSCPARSGVTIISSSSITVVAPTGTPISQGLLTGQCAQGWATCDANLGGGCCPSGYACGTAACTASVSGLTATQGKIAPNSAVRAWKSSDTLTCALAAGMIWVLAGLS